MVQCRQRVHSTCKPCPTEGFLGDEDIAVEEDALCRFCLQIRGPDDPFLAPCSCRGSQRWVHHSCLREWQLTVLSEPNNRRAVRCSICGEDFRCGLLDRPKGFATCFLPKGRKWWNLGGLGALAYAGAVLAVLMMCSQVDAPDAHNLHAGALLVATDEIKSGEFRHSVVLMVEHSCWGAKGFILNRLPLHDRSGSIQNGIGGPVSRNSYMAYLYESNISGFEDTVLLFDGNTTNQDLPEVRQVLPGVWWRQEEFPPPGSQQIILESKLAEKGLTLRMQLRGYAGWAPRQLEGEVARGSWRIVNATQDLVFHSDLRNLWQMFPQAVRR